MRRVAVALALVLFVVTPVAADTIYVPSVLRSYPPPVLTVAGGAGLYELTPLGDLVPVFETEHDVHSPAWSPDRNRVAYVSGDAGERNIYLYDTTTREHVRLTAGAGQELNTAPSWSPDGQRLAYTCWREAISQLCTMAADGSDQRQVTTGGARYDAPAWSPDGRRIAYSAVMDTSRLICTMAADGSDSRCVTSGADVHDTAPAWSPDGRRIAFASARSGVWSLYTVSANGGPLTRLTPEGHHASDPAWSPDGAQIAFTSWYLDAAQTTVRVIDLSGALLADVVAPGAAISPAWRALR